MRRLLLLLLLPLALVGAVVPTPTAQPAAKAAVSSTQVAAVNRQMATQAVQTAKAAGWETMAVDYLEGWWQGRKGWYRGSNGRTYYMWASLSVDRDVLLGKWRPVFSGECTREYGTAKVAQRCNFVVPEFHAVVSSNGLSVNSVGQRRIDGYQCVYRTATEVGQWRSYGSSYPWVMSYIDGYVVRFVEEAPNCGSIHLTQQYPVGSFLYRPATDTTIEHEWTGSPGWTRDHDMYG